MRPFEILRASRAHPAGSWYVYMTTSNDVTRWWFSQISNILRAQGMGDRL